MHKPSHIWITFLGCLALLLAAMAWVGWHTLELERTREEAARNAEQQERVRLALWRLDFQASGLVIRENARPPHDFRPFHAPEGLVNKQLGSFAKGEVLVPSPLLAELPEHVRLHFQLDSQGQITSPQVPQDGERSLALAQYVDESDLVRSEQELSVLRELLARPATDLLPQPPTESAKEKKDMAAFGRTISNKALLAEQAGSAPALAASPAASEKGNWQTPRSAAWATQQEAFNDQQLQLNASENALRNRAVVTQNLEAVKQQPMIKMKEAAPKVASKAESYDKTTGSSASPRVNSGASKRGETVGAPAASPASAAAPPDSPAGAPPAPPTADGSRTHMRTNIPEVSSRPFQGVWLGDHLVLTREAFVDGVRLVQGVWLDWPALRSAWLREISDLFPVAQLEVAANGFASAANRPADDPLLLAALPVRLNPGLVPLPPLPFWTPLRKSLAIALACMILAAAAVALVLHGTVALSERRAAFVSAVTHELRTPLTTFQLYSEMLAGGMVKDEAQRRNYLETLTGEATRLSHLVENVLAYARLERSSAKTSIESLTIGVLLDRIVPRLRQRADECGMEVRIEASEDDCRTRLRIDAAAVEQILFNLVDNACKYAAPRAAEPVIHIEADTRGKFAMLRVRDHGVGIARNERRRIFRPFHKSADQAAHSAPGVGLGLALCQRLAVALGGSITLDATQTGGACFVLKLPKFAERNG